MQVRRERCVGAVQVPAFKLGELAHSLPYFHGQVPSARTRSLRSLRRFFIRGRVEGLRSVRSESMDGAAESSDCQLNAKLVFPAPRKAPISGVV